jgi:polyisoprenyl-phosphate glycosyltransferase
VSTNEMLAPGESANDPPGVQRDSLIVLVPVYNDWEVLRLLLERLDDELSKAHAGASVIAVDDGSASTADFSGLALSAIRSLEVLHLRRNLGHQRAIAVGLAYVEANISCAAVVVMDSDGEDRPEDVMRLVAEWRKSNTDQVVFALRRSRSEGVIFRVFYTVYRWVFQAVTGRAIRFGNFSLIPRSLLRRLVAVSEIWNHYASGVQRAKVPCVYLPTDRGTRLAGHSTMSFVSLVTHGLSAMSVHAEMIGTRMLVLAVALGSCIIAAMLAVVCVRLFTSLAIPGWATFVLGLLSLMLLQIFFIALFFAGTVLHGRNAYTFLPSRDHSHFVDLLELIHVTRKG